MAGMTNSHESDCLNHMVGGSEFTWSTSIFIDFYTADPTEAGLLTNEVPKGGDARTAIPFGAAAAGIASNSTLLNIDTTNWTDTSDLTHFGLFKTSVEGAGTMIWFGALTGAPIAFSAGQILDVPIGSIRCLFRDGPQQGTANNAIVTDVGANKWLDHSLGTTRWGPGLAAVDVSLHTAAPATSGNEFGGGGYGRVTITPGTPSAGSGDYTDITHTNALSYTNIQSSPLRSWGMWQGTDLVFIRDQGSDTTVPGGSNIDANVGTLRASVD